MQLYWVCSNSGDPLMAKLFVQNRNYYYSQAPTDVSVNTFHFKVDDELPLASAATVVRERIIEFYNEPTLTYSSRISQFLSTYRRQLPTTSEMRIYNMDDPKPRVPILVYPWNLITPSPSSSPSLPMEVALCLSYVAQRESGVPVGRARGRIYLGPLASATLAGGTNVVQPTATPQLTETVRDAAERLRAYSDDPEEQVRWCMYSVSSNAMREIIGGWVDNEFDTMRSRGMRSTFRTQFPPV